MESLPPVLPHRRMGKGLIGLNRRAARFDKGRLTGATRAV